MTNTRPMSKAKQKQLKKRYQVNSYFHLVYTVIDTHWNNQISTVSIDFNDKGIVFECSTCASFVNCNHIRAVKDYRDHIGETDDDARDQQEEEATKRSLWNDRR